MSPINYPFKIKRIPTNKKPGKVLNAPVDEDLKHETETGKTIARFGYNVSFLKPVHKTGVNTADCVINNSVWEMKCPKRNKQTAIIRDLKDAIPQSNNVIIDVRRSGRPIKQTAIDIIKYLRKRRTKKIQRVLILDDKNYCYFTRNEVL